MKKILLLTFISLLILPLFAQNINTYDLLKTFLTNNPDSIQQFNTSDYFEMNTDFVNNFYYSNHKLNKIEVKYKNNSKQKKLLKYLNSQFGAPFADQNNNPYWIKDGFKFLAKKDLIEISAVRFSDQGKLDMPENVFVLDFKKMPVYANDTVQDVYILGTKKDWDSPFWSNVWIYIDEGFGVNEMLYMFQSPHDSAYQPRLDFIHLLDINTPDIMISSPTGGSGGILNLIIFSAKDGRPFVHYDSERDKNLLFTGKLLDNYLAEITFPDSSKTVLDLKNRKKFYKEYNVYTDNKLNKPVEIWGTQIVKYEIGAKNSDGLQNLILLQETRGFANIDRFALITSELSLNKENKWSVLSRKIKKY